MSWTNVQGQVTWQSTASTSLTASLASAPTAGNLLIASFSLTGTVGGTLTPPSGWTSIGSAHGTSITLWMCYRVAASGDPSSWTWTDSDSQKGYLRLDEWSGNSAAPLDVSSFVNTAGGSPATSLTLTNANELVYFQVISGSGASNIALPSGFTSLSDSFSTAPSYNVGDETFASSGATGTQTGTITGATNSAVAMVAFIQASGGGSVTGQATLQSFSVESASASVLRNDSATSASFSSALATSAVARNGIAKLVSQSYLSAVSAIARNGTAKLISQSLLLASGTTATLIYGAATLVSTSATKASGAVLRSGRSLLGSVSALTGAAAVQRSGKAVLESASQMIATSAVKRLASAILSSLSRLLTTGLTGGQLVADTCNIVIVPPINRVISLPAQERIVKPPYQNRTIVIPCK